MNSAGVIGLGYVGLPLAVELCRSGYKVVGVDLDTDKIEALEAGRSYIDDVPSETIRELVDAGKFRPTSDYAPLSDVDAISICVPTPLRKTREPDISIVADVAESISKILRPGQTIVLESTVFPGATEEVVAPILMKSGLTPGEDFLLAFSPERIDPGNHEIAVRDIPKLVGGINERSTEAAAEYYRPVFSTVISMGSAKEAEMAKLLENTFRAVNIGLVNELAILANQMGLNLWNVIDAAATKPFGFMPFYPGPGWGGHCIPVDPVYLSWKAKSYGGQTGFIDHAVQINNQMPAYVVTRVSELLNEKEQSIKGSRIMLLGVAYKRDIGDARESPALSILSLLRGKGADVTYHDPYLPHVDEGVGWDSVALTEDALRAQDCVIITTDHSSIDYEMVARTAPLVFDTRNATKNLVGSYSNVHLI